MAIINGIRFDDCISLNEVDYSIPLSPEPKDGTVCTGGSFAKKDDKKDGKVGYRYLHPRFKQEASLAMEAGAVKYAAFNFMQGHTVLQLIDALERHLDAYKWGEDYDPDCSARLNRHVHHLGNAAACLNMLFAQMAEGTLTDDRFKKGE